MSSKYLIEQLAQQAELKRVRMARIAKDFISFKGTDAFKNAIGKANTQTQIEKKTILELFIKAHPEYDAGSIELVLNLND